MTETYRLTRIWFLEEVLTMGTRKRFDNSFVAESIERLNVPEGQSLSVHGGGYKQRFVTTA